jgi:hypothetical protein
VTFVEVLVAVLRSQILAIRRAKKHSASLHPACCKAGRPGCCGVVFAMGGWDNVEVREDGFQTIKNLGVRRNGKITVVPQRYHLKAKEKYARLRRDSGKGMKER